MISLEIRREEKQVYVPTPMAQEPFFSIHATVTPIVHSNVVVEPIYRFSCDYGYNTGVTPRVTEILIVFLKLLIKHETLWLNKS
jgi:hypothetical protein